MRPRSRQRWLLPFAALLVLALGACARFGSGPRFNGSYLPDAKLLLDPDPQAYRPSRLERGEHWIVWLSAHHGGQGPLSESARRADLFIELPAPPTLGQPVDLERAPVQVSYEAGGQAITYIARSARGSLLLSAREGTALVGRLDVTLHSPTSARASYASMKTSVWRSAVTSCCLPRRSLTRRIERALMRPAATWAKALLRSPVL